MSNEEGNCDDDDDDASTVLDVYLFAGQSNMDGYGLVGEASAVDRTDTLFYGVKSTEWEGLELGKTTVEFLWMDCPDRFGPEIAFHDHMKEYYGTSSSGKEGDTTTTTTTRKLAIVKLSRGGSTLAREWNVHDTDHNELYTKFLRLIDESTSQLSQLGGGFHYKIRGFVWMQGESDSGREEWAQSYERNLSDLVGAIRDHVQIPTLPVVVGLSVNPTNPFATVVAEAQRSFVSSAQTSTTGEENAGAGAGACRLVDTSEMSRLDPRHLDTQGQLEFGKAVAEAMVSLMETEP